MHPVIARFLDPAAASSTLDKAARGDALDDDEAALAAVGNEYPELAEAVRAAAGRKSPPATTQQHLIVLATRAATRRLLADTTLGPRVQDTLAALEPYGTREDAMALVSQAVLEEAFGFAEHPDRFDAAFLEETLASLAHLAALERDVVDDWIDAFVKASADERPLRTRVAEALLEAAWSDGPEPINPEHLDDALDTLAESLTFEEVPHAAEVLADWLALLGRKQVVGPLRLARLKDILRSAATSGEWAADDDEDAEDEDDD